MSIDWSKAPEGATHYHITEDINPWRKIEGTVAYEHYRGKWLRVNSFNEGYMPDYYVPIPRETWDGQGLPPVGISVEWLSSAHGWLGGRVVGHDGSVAVVSHNDGYTGCHPHEVRPMPTPEQIAAEERAKAIDAMLDLEPPHENGFGLTSRRQFCEILYDAGYRRQEEGK
ncbi:TPA: hypothetical protein ACVGMT_003601 [Pseudomonas aeruginosa]